MERSSIQRAVPSVVKKGKDHCGIFLFLPQGTQSTQGGGSCRNDDSTYSPDSQVDGSLLESAQVPASLRPAVLL